MGLPGQLALTRAFPLALSSKTCGLLLQLGPPASRSTRWRVLHSLWWPQEWLTPTSSRRGPGLSECWGSRRPSKLVVAWQVRGPKHAQCQDKWGAGYVWSQCTPALTSLRFQSLLQTESLCPQNPHPEILTAHAMVSGGGVFRRRLGNEGGALRSRIGSFVKGPQRSTSQPSELREIRVKSHLASGVSLQSPDGPFAGSAWPISGPRDS